MAKEIHISVARKMIDSGKPVDITVYAKDGRLLRLKNCVGLRCQFRKGTRTVKLLESREVRTIRDVLIMAINDMEVYYA